MVGVGGGWIGRGSVGFGLVGGAFTIEELPQNKIYYNA